MVAPVERPKFLWREVTDAELAEDLDALRAESYPRLRLVGDAEWASTQTEDCERILARFRGIWLEDHVGATVTNVLRRRHDRPAWGRSELHDAGHLRE
jgi:hypothetical protein